MPASAVAASFQHVEEADKVGVSVGMRFNQGVANTGLGRKMNNKGEARSSFANLNPAWFESSASLASFKRTS
jgi:hypothetical protein